jgi:hypothetical protein
MHSHPIPGSRAWSGTGRARGSSADQVRHACVAEGAAIWSRRRSLLADPHPQGREALPLLCQPDGAESWRRIMPGRPPSRGRDRGGGDRPASRRVPASAVGGRRCSYRPAHSPAARPTTRS